MANPDDIMWRPSPAVIDNAVMQRFLRTTKAESLAELNQHATDDPDWFWTALLSFLDVRFYKPYSQIMDVSRGAPWARWCIGGKTNLVLNCLDKHRETPIWDKTYIVWEGEDGLKRELTYREFDDMVSRFSDALRHRGYGKGDIIGLYMPMLPEAYAAMFAVVKIGAIVLPLFSGFGADAVALRLVEGEATAVVTADGTWRRGSTNAMKPILDVALADNEAVKDVFVVRRLGDRLEDPCPMQSGRDVWWDDAVADGDPDAATEIMDAEDTAFLVFTSGTTGKPKGTVHSHIGLMVKTVLDISVCMDFQREDRMMWISDMGWVVGPLTAISTTFSGGSLVAVEGAPDYPDTARHWRLVAENEVTWLGIAPTTVRSMMRYGDEVDAYKYPNLRVIGSTGEPWTHDAWVWLFERVGYGNAPIMNVSGGTECVGIVCSSVLSPMKPGCFAGPIPGTGAKVVNEDGETLGPGEVGELVMTEPSIGNTRGIWRDDARYIENYWSMFPGMWRQGDWATVDADGMWFLLGRSDDTINVSGKRTGPSEIEGALMETAKIVEAAVIGVPDDIKGSAVCCVCTPMPGVVVDEALRVELSKTIVQKLGASYRPKQIIFVSDLPKTRNLKIMRRLVRAVILGQPEGDLTSLVNPEAVHELREHARN
jgi:acetyl-CoA synthetase